MTTALAQEIDVQRERALQLLHEADATDDDGLVDALIARLAELADIAQRSGVSA